MNEFELRLDIIEYSKALVTNNLIQSTWGNVSARLDNEYFLITPSGADYFKLKPEDIVKVKISDLSYSGNNKPSSEKALHGMIYMDKYNFDAIIHVHSSSLQVFAATRQPLVLKDKIIYPCAKYGVSGSNKLAKNVLSEISFYDGCLMANHGFMVCGKSLEECLDKCIKAEKIATILLEGDK